MLVVTLQDEKGVVLKENNASLTISPWRIKVRRRSLSGLYRLLKYVLAWLFRILKPSNANSACTRKSLSMCHPHTMFQITTPSSVPPTYSQSKPKIRPLIPAIRRSIEIMHSLLPHYLIPHLIPPPILHLIINLHRDKQHNIPRHQTQQYFFPPIIIRFVIHPIDLRGYNRGCLEGHVIGMMRRFLCATYRNFGKLVRRVRRVLRGSRLWGWRIGECLEEDFERNEAW